MSKNITKAEAANVLSDDVYDLSSAIEKARVVRKEIVRQYFGISIALESSRRLLTISCLRCARS